MEPVAVWVRKNGEWAIIHRCRRCGKLSSNRVAADDNPMKLMSIAMKPLCAPPFPLERIEEMTELMAEPWAFEQRSMLAGLPEDFRRQCGRLRERTPLSPAELLLYNTLDVRVASLLGVLLFAGCSFRFPIKPI